MRPTVPTVLDWPSPSPKEKWLTCAVTGRSHDPINTVVAVIVENSSKARPQSGLADADVVYEVLAEGGITRFLALYHCGSPRVVGPVRSVRPYFAVIAREWRAAIAHCGGDSKDIDAVRSLNLVDVDELHDGRGFWRDRTRGMPHNLYVSANNVRSRAAESAKAASATTPAAPTPPWGFKDWEKSPARGLDINYGKSYTVSYRLASGCYERLINGSPHRDRESGKTLTAANVIVQFAKSRVVYADLGLAIDLTGKGRAVYLLGGKVSEGYWEKEDDQSPTRFLTADGKRIDVAKGVTWVQVVPEDAVVTPK